jgi:hypothetical protein
MSGRPHQLGAVAFVAIFIDMKIIILRPEASILLSI